MSHSNHGFEKTKRSKEPRQQEYNDKKKPPKRVDKRALIV